MRTPGYPLLALLAALTMSALLVGCGIASRPKTVPPDWKPVDYHGLRIWVPNNWTVKRALGCGEPDLEVWTDAPVVVAPCGTGGPAEVGAWLQVYNGVPPPTAVTVNGLAARHGGDGTSELPVYRDGYVFTDLRVDLRLNAIPAHEPLARTILGSVQRAP